MARGGWCPACGSRLTSGAAFCSTCGTPTGRPGPVLDELGAIDRPGDEGAPTTEPTPGPRRRPLVAGMVAVGAVVVLAAGIALGAAWPDGDRSTATAPTTPVTTAPKPSTTAAPTTVTRSVVGSGPVFGVPVGSDLVALVNQDGEGRLVRVDLDTGAAQIQAVEVLSTPTTRLLVRDGAIVVTDESSAMVLRPDRSTQSLELTDGGNVAAFSGPQGNEVWGWSSASRNELGLFGLPQGELIRRIPLPAGTTAVGTDPDGRLLLQSVIGGAFRYDPETRQADQVSAGRLVALGREVVVEEVCDQALSCRVVARNLATGARRLTTIPIGRPLAPGRLARQVAVLSPDEHLVAAWSEQGTILVVDTRTGTVVRDHRSTTAQSVAWTLDGQWLLALGEAGLVAHPNASLGPGQPVTVAGVDLTDVVAFAIVAHAA